MKAAHASALAAGFVTGLALLSTAAGAACRYQRVGSVPLDWSSGRPMIEGSVNGHPARVLADSSTTGVALSTAFANRLGLGLEHVPVEVQGVGGPVQDYRARVDEITFGKVVWKAAHVEVFDIPAPADAVAGASFLFQRDLEMTADAITFFEPADCGDSPLGYWADDVPWVATEPTSERHREVIVTVKVNGRAVRAFVASGAQSSLLDLSVARELGFVPPADGQGSFQMGGTGNGRLTAWSTVFDTFEIGPETIRRPHVAVGDLHVDAKSPHMLLGADFLRGHRLLFAGSQHRLYLSYLGGPLFHAPAQAASAPQAK